MRGSLSEFTLAELLQLFSLAEKSGAIEVEYQDTPSRLTLETGRVVGWSGSNFDLQEALCDCRLLPDESKDQIRSLDRTREDEGVALGRLAPAFVDPVRWRPFVQRLIEQRVYPLLSEEQGSFAIEVGRPEIPPDVHIDLSVQQLILDGSRWEADLNELSHEGYSVESEWRRYGTIPANPNVELSPLDWLIWAELAEPSTVDSLAERLCYPNLETVDAVKSLYLKRVIDRVEAVS